MGKGYKKTILNHPKEIFLKQCGAEQEFPALKETIMNKSVLMTETEETSTGFENMVYIDYAIYDGNKNRLSLRTAVSLLEKASIIMTDIHVLTKDGKELGCIRHTASDTNRDVCWYHMDDISPEMIAGSVLNIKAQTSWQEEKDGAIKALEIEDDYIVNVDTNVKEIILEAPVHKSSKAEDYITVAYNRAASQEETIDYTYRCDLRPDGQFLYLDCSGEVILEGKSYSEIYSYNMLVDSYNGVAVYNNEEGFQTEKTEKGFKWSFNNQWNRFVPARRLPLRDPVIFRLRIEFYCENETDPDNILISSDLEDIGVNNEKKISQLKMLWGCVAEDTHILMADGSSRYIRDIKPGDMVMGANKKPQRVVDVITGQEKELQVTETEDGHKLLSTYDHPFQTEKKGMIQAKELTGIDRLLMKDGNYTGIRFIYGTAYEGTVYNLILEGEQDNSFICNGFVTGDFIMQNKVSASVKENSRTKDTLSEKEIEQIRSYREEISDHKWKYGR